MDLREFVVTTGLGNRTWLAEDAEHAAEQHVDAFPDEPILMIQEVTP